MIILKIKFMISRIERIKTSNHLGETMPKFPEITVKLVGEDGNAFAIIGKVKKALKKAGYNDEVESFMKEAMSGDYNNLLRVAMEYVEVE